MSFEPMAEVFAALALNIAVNDLSGVVTPVLSALGSTASDVDVPSLRLSLNRVSNSGQTALGRTPARAHGQGEKQKNEKRGVMPLDALGLQRVALIKIGMFCHSMCVCLSCHTSAKSPLHPA